MAVGGRNTFLSSWADDLEIEMLCMSNFNTGGKISFSFFFFFSLSFFSLSRDPSLPNALPLAALSPLCLCLYREQG